MQAPESAIVFKRSPRRGDSGERGGDHDRRANIVRSVPLVSRLVADSNSFNVDKICQLNPTLKAVPIDTRSPRHGDSNERNDPDHDRRDVSNKAWVVCSLCHCDADNNLLSWKRVDMVTPVGGVILMIDVR